tara:strand:- start:209 stop:370 length:162 start_codon:yes stop_codon:yes gene_type:complete
MECGRCQASKASEAAAKAAASAAKPARRHARPLGWEREGGPGRMEGVRKEQQT